MLDRDILESQKILEPNPFNVNNSDIQQLMLNRKYKQVLNCIETVPISKQKYFTIAYAYLGLKDWKKLSEICDVGLKFTNNSEAQFYNLKGKAQGKLNKHHEQILLTKSAIGIDPTNPSYYRNLGSAYYNIQRYSLAIQEYQKAIQLQPENVLNYHNKGAAHLKNQQYEKAIQSFQQALKINPKLALSYSWLGDCFKEMKDFQNAKSSYQKAFDLSGKRVYLQELEKMGSNKI